MSGWKKLAQAAAASGEVVNVEDLFEDQMYYGNGRENTVISNVRLGTSYAGSSAFFQRRTNDYLRKTSDFTGNSDRKTFTLSYWFMPFDYSVDSGSMSIYNSRLDSGSNQGFQAAYQDSGSPKPTIYATNSSGTAVLNAQPNTDLFERNKWNHLLVSIDMANTSNRRFYVNDVDRTSNVVFSTYSNQNIDFTQVDHYIGRYPWSGAGAMSGYLAHLYLDSTYRDLTNSANRRLFITSSGTPATGQASLNPIMYMPFTTDGTSILDNQGTGGDFNEVNGKAYIDDTFGPDESEETARGGFVHLKNISGNGYSHQVYDTERGVTKRLQMTETSGENTRSEGLVQFNATGYSLGSDGWVNGTSSQYIATAFANHENFVDVVTYSGNSTSGRTVSHNLGVVPAMMIFKRTDTSGYWWVWHKGMNGGTNPEQYASYFPAYDGDFRKADLLNDTMPTATEFTLGNDGDVNASGGTYVAYLFASNEGTGTFGPDGDADIIKCGYYTGNGSSTGLEITTGFEPQYLMIKRMDNNTEAWHVFHSCTRGMLGAGQTHADAYTIWNTTTALGESNNLISPTPDGFLLERGDGAINASSGRYIYLAVSKPSLKVPEYSRDVFRVENGDGSTIPGFFSGWEVDSQFNRDVFSFSNTSFGSRKVGNFRQFTNSNSSDSQDGGYRYDYPYGWYTGSFSTDYYSWMWREARGFHDTINYKGNGTAGRTIKHNLAVAPEMIWVRNRSANGVNWAVYHSGNGSNPEQYTNILNSNISRQSASYWNNTAPTASVFTVGSDQPVNNSNQWYSAYLWASLDGISKCGSYTGNGSSQTIDCGFTNGAAMVIIKSVSVNGNWICFDWLRGITTADNNYIKINDGDAQTTTSGLDIDPTSSGFIVDGSNSNINQNGATYMFYAVAATTAQT